MYDEVYALPVSPEKGDHVDNIERLDDVFYIRWTAGPDYERAFICIDDDEPDMNDIAAVSWDRAKLFAHSYRTALILARKEKNNG